MGAVAQLDAQWINAFREYQHPLDWEAEKYASRESGVSPKRVQILLSVIDSCFHDQDPANYEHDWLSDEDRGVRMYRKLTAGGIGVLLNVVEAAHDVTLTFKNRNIIMDAHDSFVDRRARSDAPRQCLVVHHPSESEPIEI